MDMNMRFKVILFALVIALVVVAAGCGGSDTPANISNTNAVNTTTTNTVANSALQPTKAPEVPTTNNAPTLAPVVHAYYDALKAKDAAAVKKVMAQEFLKSTETAMADEKKTDIITFLTEFDKLPEPKMEVRNEQITGNRGVAEVKGGSYVGWAKIVFLNEGGAWKISNEVAR